MPVSSATSERGNRNSTPAHTPSPLPSPDVPSRCESRWLSHRSTPRAGTSTSSVANGSSSGVDQQVAEGVGEQVGPRGAVEVEHHGATLCAAADATGWAPPNSPQNCSRSSSDLAAASTSAIASGLPWNFRKLHTSSPAARAAETNCEMLVALPPSSHQRSATGHQPGAAGPTYQSTPAGRDQQMKTRRGDDPRPGLDRVGGAAQRLALDRLDPALGPLVLLAEQHQAAGQDQEARARERDRRDPDHDERTSRGPRAPIRLATAFMA